MNETQKNKLLLPTGFGDLLPPEAEQESAAIAHILKTFKSFGFGLIKPPLVEYEDSLFAPGPGADLKNNTFRLMDPVSHKMMGLRSDITAQIARIASSRLSQEKRPLRLSYANDVLRTLSSQQRTARQFTQVGCEIIGWDHAQADIEIAVVALKSLAELDVGGLVLDINIPRLTRMVLDDYNIHADQRDALEQAVLNKDIDAIKSYDNKAAQIFETILGHTKGDADDTLSILEDLDVGEQIKTQIDDLRGIYDGLKEGLDGLNINDVSINIDVLENHGVDYHCGVSFAIFSSKSKGPLGRGGRYVIQRDERAPAESATGFTIYMDTLREAMDKAVIHDMLFVDRTVSWAQIEHLRAQGWVICRADEQTDIKSTCSHEYRDGKVVKL